MFESNKDGNPGIRLYYDPKYQDVYFVPGNRKDDGNINVINGALCFSE